MQIHCRIMWNHGRSCKIMPWKCLKVGPGGCNACIKVIFWGGIPQILYLIWLISDSNSFGRSVSLFFFNIASRDCLFFQSLGPLPKNLLRLFFGGWLREFLSSPDFLSFLSLIFLILPRKTSKLPRVFCPCRTHKILGKDWENTKFTKEFPCLKFTKEIQKTKERKDRGFPGNFSDSVEFGKIRENSVEFSGVLYGA